MAFSAFTLAEREARPRRSVLERGLICSKARRFSRIEGLRAVARCTTSVTPRCAARCTVLGLLRIALRLPLYRRAVRTTPAVSPTAMALPPVLRHFLAGAMWLCPQGRPLVSARSKARVIVLVKVLLVKAHCPGVGLGTHHHRGSAALLAGILAPLAGHQAAAFGGRERHGLGGR